MRCNQCNVDLGEEYKRCPLCGTPSVDEPPVIAGERTAEYPDIVYKKNPVDFFKIFVISFLAVSAVSIIIDLIINKGVKDSLWAVFGIPCVWALFFRPICIRKLYFGSYIIHDLVYLSALMLWYSKTHFVTGVESAVALGIPMILSGALVLFVVGLFVFPERRTNALPCLVAVGVFGLILFVVSAIAGYNVIFPSVVTVASCIAITALTLAMPTQIKDEFAARFHA